MEIRRPVPHDGADGDPLARDADAGPVDGDPADGKGQGRVDEEAGVAHVGARHGGQRRQLGQAQHDADDEAADGGVALYERGRRESISDVVILGVVSWHLAVDMIKKKTYNQSSRRTGTLYGLPAAQKQPRADGASEGNHL